MQVVIILYQLVEQTKQLLILLKTATNEHLSSLVSLIYLQNQTMKNLRFQESYIANSDMLVHQNCKNQLKHLV